jgi:hypothetical protein
VVLAKDFDSESGYLYVDEDTPGNTVEDLSPADLQVSSVVTPETV